MIINILNKNAYPSISRTIAENTNFQNFICGNLLFSDFCEIILSMYRAVGISSSVSKPMKIEIYWATFTAGRTWTGASATLLDELPHKLFCSARTKQVKEMAAVKTANQNGREETSSVKRNVCVL
mmetsp:Transcript_2244/g.4819  ORF Transcript_2244/g.4819 Transcript_2244/m.4819 type:complete len:125 (+) Transcript_2244:1453-1827(+)